MGLELGRISGVMLRENLDRHGINLSVETDLLYLDVNNKSIGINSLATNNATSLFVDNSIKTTGLKVDTKLTLPSIDITTGNNTITSRLGSLYLSASDRIVTDNIRTDDINFDDNIISSTSTNQSIELRPHGTGDVNLSSTLNVTGNLYASGDILIEGTVVFGDTDDANIETVEINAAINSDLVPSQDEFYSLGNSTHRWLDVYPNLMNGQEITAVSVQAGGIDLILPQGKTWYVSQNGSDTNHGDHEASTFRSIKHAASHSAVAPGDTIIVYPGTYEELTPIVIPQGVALRGMSLRSVKVVPHSTTISNNIFEVNGETTISDFTVADFQYDSVNDTGYAFSFADNFKVTTRSPYIQNISVITSGSVTTVEDPRGFAAGDAGKGALVDGSKALSTSIEATMLFHSVTFITPGVNALTMTNGVRVEWLNSFVYFADIAMYATAGVGRYDAVRNETRYGAEVRSIGSACVYGNYGAWADGQGTLMYLINHNFAYIGAGKDSNNDSSLNNRDDEVTMLNTGKIYFQSVDNKGNFSVGDPFQVSFETGSASISGLTVTGDAVSSINFGSETSETVINALEATTGNIKFSGNTITSLYGDINLASGTDTLNVTLNVNAQQNLDVVGNVALNGVFTLGNQPLDIVQFDAQTDTNLLPSADNTYTLGSGDILTNRRWKTVYSDRLDIANGQIQIFDNIIQTSQSNSALELRATGTGLVYVDVNNVEITNTLTVNSTTTTQNIEVTGDISQTGDIVQTGDRSISNGVDLTGNISATVQANFETISVTQGQIATTLSNADLELGAAGTGQVAVPTSNVLINNNLSVDGSMVASNAVITDDLTSSQFDSPDVSFYGNTIITRNLDQNLLLSAHGTGVVSTETSDVTLGQALQVDGLATLGNVVTVGLKGHTGDLDLTGNQTQTGNYSISNNLTVSLDAQFANIDIDNNVITTTDSSSDLELRAAGVGKVVVNDNFNIVNNLNVVGVTATNGLTNSGTITSDKFSDGNILITENYITTTTGNLTLAPNLNGIVSVASDNVLIDNNLQVNGTTTLTNTVVGKTLTTQYVQNVAGADGAVGFFFLGSWAGNPQVGLQLIQPGWTVVGHTTWIVDSTNETLQTVTITGGTFVSGQSYAFTGPDPATITVTGTINRTGNVTETGNYDLSNNLTVTSTATLANIDIVNNTIATSDSNSDLELGAAGTGKVLVDDVFRVNQALNVVGPLATNSVTNSGTVGSDVFSTGEIVLKDNYITTLSNADLTLGAQPAGTVYVPFDAVYIDNNLTVVDLTSTKNVIVGGDVNLTGSKTQTGNVIQTGNLSISSNLTVTGTTATFPDVSIVNNVIKTLATNSDLELRAAGNGVVRVGFDNVAVAQALRANGVTTTSTINNSGTINSDEFINGNILIKDNFITTTQGNDNLILAAAGTGGPKLEKTKFSSNVISTESLNDNIVLTVSSGGVVITGTNAIKIPVGTAAARVANNTGDIRLDTTDALFSGWNGARVTFGGLYSTDRLTRVSAHPTNNTINFVTNNTTAMTLASTGLTPVALQVNSNLFFNNNTITATTANSSVYLSPNGTGRLLFENIAIVGDEIRNLKSTAPLTLENTGYGYVAFGGTGGIAIPSGPTVATPDPSTELGDFRFNTDLSTAEVFNGVEYVSLSGTSSALLTAAEIQEITNLWGLVLG